MAETHLSPEAHARLVAELDDLTTRGRVEIARQIESARALGDLSENGDYHAAKDAQGKMESRVRQLQAMLSSAVIVDPQASGGAVAAGSIVGLRTLSGTSSARSRSAATTSPSSRSDHRSAQLCSATASASRCATRLLTVISKLRSSLSTER